MMLLRTLAPWLLLACLAHQVSMSGGAREKGRNRKGDGRASEQLPTPAPGRAERGGKGAPKGKFTTKDKMQCTWAARVEDTVKLGVTCKNPAAAATGGVSEIQCEYTATPSTCPGYGTNPASFWKQVVRSLKKLQRKLCQDARALVRTGMCKRAPQNAHFSLDIDSSVVSAQQPDTDTRRVDDETPRRKVTKATSAPAAGAGPTTKDISCTDRADQQKLAEEYCSSSWASMCMFFFSMVQSGDC